jgi:hypothetical protein
VGAGIDDYGFRRSRGRYVLRADPTERAILADLVGQLVELVEPHDDAEADPLARMVGIDPDAERPDDPAVARLFPDAYDDDESASEFRRFTERSLRDAKVAHARTVLDGLAASGDKVVLNEAQAVSWLGTLNDLRLTLGSRLGITDERDDWEMLPEEHPAALLFSLYDWLTFLQETLVHALSGLSSVPPDPTD